MQLMPNVVYYENWTVIDGDHIELSEDRKKFLRRVLSYNHKQVMEGMLAAISDPRTDGRPAAC